MTTRLDAAIHELVEAIAEAVRAEAATGPATPDKLYSVDEAAAILGIGRSALYSGPIARGELSTIKLGRRRLVPSSVLHDYIADRAA